MEKKELQERPLDEKESLELIARMIRNTQQGLERGAGFPMLIWGYATIFATLAVWIAVRLTSDYHYNFLWFLIPLIGLVGMMLQKKHPAGVRTYLDQVIRYIWMVLGSTAFMLSVMSITTSLWTLPILFIIILIMGIGIVLTGLVIAFKPAIIGGIVALLIGVAHYLIPDYDMKMLTFALAFVVMYIIPGHILNDRARKACLKN
jgi:hypothetical protein